MTLFTSGAAVRVALGGAGGGTGRDQRGREGKGKGGTLWIRGRGWIDQGTKER